MARARTISALSVFALTVVFTAATTAMPQKKTIKKQHVTTTKSKSKTKKPSALKKRSQKSTSNTSKGRMVVVIGQAGRAYARNETTSAGFVQSNGIIPLIRFPVARVSTYQNQPWITSFRPDIQIVNSGPTHNYVQAFGQVYSVPTYPSGTTVTPTSGMRIGFYQYVSQFADSYFYYQNYGYAPGSNFYSPWYYYSNLPPYVPSDAVSVVPNYTSSAFEMDWVKYDPAVASNPVNDQVINVLNTAFRLRQPALLNRIARNSGKVAVYLGGQYLYSVAGADFARMSNDLILGTQTTGFQVDSAQTFGSQLRLKTTHQYIDSQGIQHVAGQVWVFGDDQNGNTQLLEFGSYN